MMLTDAPWAALAPPVEQVRPHAQVPPSHLRRTTSAILWRHQNGAKWRAIPAELGPLGSPGLPSPAGPDDRRGRSWWKAAQTFIRWSRLGVWKRLLALVQERGVPLAKGRRSTTQLS